MLMSSWSLPTVSLRAQVLRKYLYGQRAAAQHTIYYGYHFIERMAPQAEIKRLLRQKNVATES